MGTARYKSTFYGQNSGIEYQFELHDLDYTGAATEVVLDSNGAVIEWTQEEEVFSPIRSSQCTVVMKIENTSMESTIMSLIEKADKKLYIVIYKDSEPYWGGPVNMKGMEIEQNSNPPYIKWQAMDWIGGLQNLTWSSANWGIITNGLNSYVNVLADMFIKAYPSFANTFYMPNTTLFSTASPVTSTQFSGTPDPFKMTGFYAFAYTDDKYNFSFTYHQVLEMMLTDWCAKVIYSDGIYRVIDQRMYNWAGSWVEYFYDKNGAQVSTQSYDNRVTYDGDDYVWAVDPLLTLDVPIKKVMRTFRTELSLRLDDSEGYLTTLNDGKSFNQLYGTNVGRVLTGWVTNFKSPIVTGDSDLVQVTIRLNVKDATLLPCLKLFYLVIQASYGGTTYRLRNNVPNLKGVTPNGDIAPNEWAADNKAFYIITPFVQNAQSVFTYKFKMPAASATLENVEYGFSNESIEKRGSINNGTNVIFNIDASNLKVGMRLEPIYTGIPNPTFITNITTTTGATGQKVSKVTLDQNVTQNLSNALFYFTDLSGYIYLGDETKAQGSVEVTILPGGSVATNEGAQYFEISNNQANINIELPDARVGDELNNAGKTALQVYNGTAWVYSTSKWKYMPSLTSEAVAPLHQKLVRNISEFRITALKRYQGTLYYKQYYSPHKALIYNINGQDYTLVFNGGAMTLDADQLEGEWWLIKRTTGISNGNATNTGTKIGTKDIYKDVYPYTDVPKLDNDIKISQYEIGAGTQALSMIRGAVQLLSESTLDYIASDPQFAFQETGTTPTATNVKEGDICFTNANGKFWKYTNGAWAQQYQAAAAGSGITTIGTIDSQTKSANGLVISGSNLVAQTADASNVGMVSTGAQTFAGAKTFNAAVTLLRSIISGTGGNGYTELPSQSSAPSTPASGFRLFADSLSRFAWKGLNGFLRILDGTGNTADRTYTLQDKSGTLAHTSDIRVDTRGQLSSAVTLGNTTTQTLLHTITIPAGTLVAGDSVKVQMVFTCNNNANSKSGNVTINTTTGTMAGTILMGANTGGIMEVTFKVTSATNIRALNMNNSQSYNITTGAGPRNYTVSDIATNSFTIDIYGLKATSGTDTLILEHATAIIQKS